MKVVLAQINPTVGDILGNYKKMVSNIDKFTGDELCFFWIPWEGI